MSALFNKENFPTLEPAFTIRSGGATSRFPVGDTSVGGGMTAIPFYNGVIESVPGFSPAFKFNVSNGIDYVTVDKDQRHGRFNVKAVLTDEEGRNVVLNIEAITELHPDVVGIIDGAPDAKSAPFGYCVEQLRFWSGHEDYKPLEAMYFASSQRFTVAPDGTAGAELRVSRIVSGTGSTPIASSVSSAVTSSNAPSVAPRVAPRVVSRSGNGLLARLQHRMKGVFKVQG